MRKVTFEGAQGDALAARLDLPDGPRRAVALFAHCFSCGKDIAAARRIATRLAASGFAVLRFDFTGLGHSGGEFANTTFTSNVGDLVAAARWLEGEGLAPDLLIGHSLGGAAVLRAAAAIPSARAVATLGAPVDPGHVTHSFADALPRIEAEGRAEVSLGGRPFTVGRDFVRDVAEADLAPAIAGLKRALLVLHAPRDGIVGIDNAQAIFTAAKHPKSFVTLDEADHLLSGPADADYAAGVIAAWAERYLDLAALKAPAGAPEGVVRASEADPAGFLQDIAAGPRHHLTGDEPAAFGGTDRGPSPYQFVAAGLAACTAMTIRMYARRKNLPLEHVFVDVTHDKVHAEDGAAEDEGGGTGGGTGAGGGGRIDRFARVVHLRGDLSAEQRARLMQIADRCPVHRTLEAAARIETRAGAAETG